MQRFRFARSVGLGGLLLLAACQDRSPTAVGGEFFPEGVRPVTAELPAALDSFQVLGRFAGYTGPADAPFLLVANRFDGALNAAALARIRGFPSFVNVLVDGTSRVDSTFAYLGGELFAAVDSAGTEVLGAPLLLELRALPNAPESDTLFERGVIDTAGSRLIATKQIAAGSPVATDTVRFALDSLEVRRIVSAETRGLLIRATGGAGRVQLGSPALRTSVRPSLRRDTTIATTASDGPRTFVFSPEQPLPPNTLVAGGVRSARTLFRVVLPDSVPACGPGQGSGCTARVSTRDIAINEAALILDPLPVPGGFRPLQPVPLQLRIVADPALGARAPLGDNIQDPTAINPATGQAAFQPIFYTPGNSNPVTVPVTGFVQALASRDTAAVRRAGRATTLALLAEPEVATFGEALFRMVPRLRLVYTLPVRSGLR